LTGRLPLWEELGTEVSKSPLLGYGYLAFWNAKKVEYLSDLFKWEIPHGHNTYIDVALDIGIIGACFWIAWHLSALWVSGQLFAQTREVEFSVVFGLVVVAIVNGFAESLFKLPGFLMFTTVATFACILNKNNTPIRLKRRKRTLLRVPSR
jgi:O-antigen ligase